MKHYMDYNLHNNFNHTSYAEIKDLPVSPGINFLSILLTALLTYFFARKRYTYEKLYDKRLASLEKIYCKVVSLEKDLKKYIYTTDWQMDNVSLIKKQEKLSLIQQKFCELEYFFKKKEILLDENSVFAIKNYLDIAIQTVSNLIASKISQSIGDHITASNQWRTAYESIEEKLVKTGELLKKDFRATLKRSWF